MFKTSDYLEKLKKRKKRSHVSHSFQFVGLFLTEILNDEKHKSLYIKLAKNHNHEMLIGLAKRVAERKKIKNKGAYFMTMLKRQKG